MNERMLDRRRFLRVGSQAAGLGLAAVLGPLGFPRTAGAQSFPVTIITTAGNTTLSFVQLMKNLGYLTELGLEAEYVSIGDGSKIIGALVGGSADIAVGTGFSQVLPAIEKGGDLRIVAGANLLPTYAVYSSRPDIKELKDLVGRTVGTGSVGALQHQLMVALLKKHGIDPADVTFVNIGSAADVFRAVVAGTVDAGPSEIDVYDQQEKYGVHTLVGGKIWEELPEFTFQGTYTTTDAIAEKRDTLVRVLAAYAKLYRFISSPESREAFLQARLQTFQGTDPADVTAQGESQWNFYQSNQSYAVDLTLSEDRIRYLQELNVEHGIQQRILPYDEVVDMSLAAEALALLDG